MKMINKLGLVTGATALMTMLPMSAGAAGNASLSLSGNGGSYTTGATFTATIYENSGAETVNVVEADFVYDSNVLQLVGMNCGGGFEIATPASASGITCGTVSPKSGSQVVGTVSFKTLAAGTGSVSFGASSAVYRSTDNVNIWNGMANTASYGVVTPAPRVAAPTTSAPAAQEETAAPVEEVKTVVKPVTKTPAVTNLVKPTASDTARSGMWRILGYLGLVAIATGIVIFVSRRRASATAAATAAASTVKAAASKKKSPAKA